MYIKHKIKLCPNNKQQTYLIKACGVARFSYNWALAEWNKMYNKWKENNSLQKPNANLLRKKFNSIKKTEFPWVLEVTKCASERGIIHLGYAFENFFKHQTQCPKFKKKGKHDAFTVSSQQFNVNKNYVKIPRLKQPIKMMEELRFDGKLISVTISRVANQWFASFTLEVEDVHVENQNMNIKSSVGIDLGIINFATLSNGSKINAPKPLKKLLKKVRFLSKSLHRKVVASSNYEKAKLKLSKLHAKIANIRSDFLHKLTNNLIKKFSLIGIENLNVSGMIKNKKLAREISDLGFYEFKRQLKYKVEKAGIKLVIADHWFPSSKLCSECGHRLKNLGLDKRVWTCPKCGYLHDRDINAALNLRDYAVSSTVCSLSK